MAYTPPIGNSIILDFGSGGYTPQIGSNVVVEFSTGPEMSISTAVYNLNYSNIHLFKTSYYCPVTGHGYIVVRNDINLLRGRVLPITSGIYTLNLYLETNTTMAIGHAEIVSTFNDFSTNKGPYFQVEPLTILATLTDITFSNTRIIPIDTGVFTVSPVDIQLNKGWTFSISPATYTLSMVAIATSRSPVMLITPASYILTTGSVILDTLKRITISSGTYSLTINPAVIGNIRIFPISPTSISSALIPVELKRKVIFNILSNHTTVILGDAYRIQRAAILPIDSSSQTSIFNNILLTSGTKITLGTNYLLNSYNVSITKQNVLPIQTSNYTVTTSNVIIGRITPIPISTSNYSVTFNPIGLTKQNSLVFSVKSLNLNLYDTSLLFNGKLNIDTMQINSTMTALLKYNRTFTISPLTLTNTFNGMYLIRGLELSRDIRVLSNAPGITILDCISDTNLYDTPLSINSIGITNNISIFINQ